MDYLLKHSNKRFFTLTVKPGVHRSAIVFQFIQKLGETKMLNQKQAEPVKSSLNSKNVKSSLVGKFIKSKLYLLILLPVTTGGIFIGNSMVPEQIPPAQALPSGSRVGKAIKIIDRGAIKGSKVQKIRVGEVVTWFCDGGGYGSIAEHTVQLGRSVWKLDYNNPLSRQFNKVGTHKYWVDGVLHYIEVYQ
jgi:hypothetical protein